MATSTAVVRNWEDTDDLYQSVCLVLWRKFELFRPGSNFFAWARQTAKNKVGDFVRQKQSPTYVTEELMDILAESAPEPHDVDAEVYLVALRRCREKLTAEDEELLQLRYVEELSTVEIADRLQRLRPKCKSVAESYPPLVTRMHPDGTGEAGAFIEGTLMSDHAINLDRLFDLVGTVCDDGASPNDFIELDSIVQVDRGARDWYLGYCRLHGTLRLELRAHRATQAVFEQISIEPTDAAIKRIGRCEGSGPRFPRPHLPCHSAHSLFHPTIGYSSGWTISYLSRDRDNRALDFGLLAYARVPS